MNLQNWKNLSEEEQANKCQQLNPYEDWDLFKAIEAEFITTYGGQDGIAKVFCGNAGTLGPFSAICVTIKRGSKRTRLPKRFLGFPILRIYESQK